ncbi:MAG: cyclase family protein [Desulfobacterales bacterium]|nr:cyclase family protein [Desulfobacterales bacterium]
MNIIDLSYPINNEMSSYPGDPPIQLNQVKDIDPNASRVTHVSFGTHSGTHVDAPSHMIKQGKHLNEFELSHFMGRTIKFHINQWGHYPIKNEHYDGILIETGWGNCFHNPHQYFSKNRPSIPLDIAESISESGVKFLGCDLPSVDKSGSPEKQIHLMLLSKHILIYESLANLSLIPNGIPFMFIGFPLPFSDIDGSPVRAIAILNPSFF